jgi:hypothetical protein
MLLSKYPAAIAQVENELLQIDQRMRSIQSTKGAQSAFIDREVAFDESLKNDVQRKARRSDLLQCDADYQQILICYQELCDRRERLQIELSLLRNEFTVLKLEVRRSIVFQERQLLEAA